MRLMSCLLGSLFPALAVAGGLEIPGHGARATARAGAFAARADDATAVAHNPGALSKLQGAHLSYSHALVWHHATFTRAESQIPSTGTPGRDPLETVENETPLFPLGAMLAATWRLSGDEDTAGWTVGASVFGPSGSGHVKYPVDGGQRYMLTEVDAALIYYGLSAAYGDGQTFGVGVTAQYVDLPYLRYALVVDGQPGGDLNPYASVADVEGVTELSDRFAVSALAGVWWRPTPSWELALAGRVIPIRLKAEGDLTLNNLPGQTQFTREQLRIRDAHAALDLTLPPTADLALRYIHERFDLEIDLVYEAWSMVNTYNIDLEGQIVLFANEPAEDVRIDKRWRDTVALRLGGTYAAIPDLVDLSAGAFIERGATPNGYTHLDFMSLDRLGLALGGTWRLPTERAQIALSLAYSHIFQPSVTVDELDAKVVQQRPVAQCPDACDGYTGMPANAGRFESSFDSLALSVDIGF